MCVKTNGKKIINEMLKGIACAVHSTTVINVDNLYVHFFFILINAKQIISFHLTEIVNDVNYENKKEISFFSK